MSDGYTPTDNMVRASYIGVGLTTGIPRATSEAEFDRWRMVVGQELNDKAEEARLARAERDALAQQIAAVRERGVDHTSVCDSWSDMNGSDCTCGVAILAPSPVTPDPQTITVTPEVLAKLQEAPPASSIPYAGYGPQYWVNLDEIHPPVTPESETT